MADKLASNKKHSSAGKRTYEGSTLQKINILATKLQAKNSKLTRRDAVKKASTQIKNRK